MFPSPKDVLIGSPTNVGAPTISTTRCIETEPCFLPRPKDVLIGSPTNVGAPTISTTRCIETEPCFLPPKDVLIGSPTNVGAPTISTTSSAPPPKDVLIGSPTNVGAPTISTTRCIETEPCLLFGALTIGLAYAVDCLGETAFLISFNVFGMVGSPVLGVIINGIFIRFVNSWGAGAGLLVSLAVGLYVGIDPMLDPPPVKTLPLRTDGCWAANLTSEMTSALLTTTAAAYTDATSLSPSGEGESSRIYLSYQHYSTLTLLISVVVASLVSLVTGRNSKQVVDPRTYIHYSWTSLTSDTQTTYDMNDTSGESSDDGKVILADINRDGKSGHQENGEKPSKIIPDGLV
ncbi:hypothetical protein RRG08_012433 [Elysia crispata]|uniref:Uncharacterized protein n=1 Tax=Elysia crispata TaxID=231223 RepID=A0AAE1AG40_9GAST|nr:hypothetical protein RRG08_012433 [Elysia crispata]